MKLRFAPLRAIGGLKQDAGFIAPGGRGRFFEVLTASELGLSFGRERVIHAALGFGGLTERIREDAIRLSGVRELGGGVATGKVKKTI